MSTNEVRNKVSDLNALRVFVVVAESASFSAAARKLNLPKWSVSRSVSALEAAMGVPLLHRTTRHVTLSPAGMILHTRVAPLISSLDVAANVWPEELGEPAGDVHISIPNFFQTELISDAITKFSARYPAVHVNVRITSPVMDVVVDGFDLALWIGPAQMKNSSLVARRGWHVIGQFFASPAYLASRGTPSSPADLANHECVIFHDISSIPLMSPDGPATFKPNGHIRSNDIFFAREAVRSGAGIGLLPTYLVEKDLAAGRLVHVLPRYRSLDSYVYIVRPSTHEVPLRVKMLSDFLFDYMKVFPLSSPTK